MTTAQSTIEVNVPLSTAYNQWTQLESFPKFMGSVESVTQIDDTRTHWVTKIAGVEREFDAEITDQVADDHLAWHSIGELKQGGRVEFETVSAEVTKITLTLTWDPEGFVESAGAALQVDDATVRKDLQNFKKFIEDKGVEEGGWRGEVHGNQTTDGGNSSPQI